MADGKKISELTESASIQDAHYFPVSDGAETKKVSYSTIKNDLIDYSDQMAEVISPTITSTDIDGGHRLTIEDYNGTTTVNVMDGEAGPSGPRGLPGPQGETGTFEDLTTAQVQELASYVVDDACIRAFDTVADMQAAIDLQAGMVCHTNGFNAAGDGGAAYYSIDTAGTANGIDVLTCYGGLFAVMIDDVPRKVFDGDSFAHFIKQDNWHVYSGNNVTIDTTIDLTGANARKQIVENCTITLDANMFTWTSAHEELPWFVNCTFMGNGNAIIDDVSNGRLYCSGSRFINCKFYNCRMSNHALFIQSPRFTNCRWYADSANDFITANCVQEADFVSCQWEWNFANSSLMNIENAATYFGLQATKFTNCIAESLNTVFIKATNSFMLTFNDCYFEGISQLINFSQCRAAEGNSPLGLYFNRCYINKPQSADAFVYIDSSYTPASVPGASKRHIEFNSCKFIGVSGTTGNAMLNTYAFPNTRFSGNVYTDAAIWDFRDTDITPVNAQKFTNITATNTAITITNTGDQLHPAWPCIFGGQIKNRATQVFDILILFIGEISSGPYCKCLSNPSLTFPASKSGNTITIDLTSGNFDYMMRTTGFYLPLGSIGTMFPQA